MGKSFKSKQDKTKLLKEQEPFDELSAIGAQRDIEARDREAVSLPLPSGDETLDYNGTWERFGPTSKKRDFLQDMMPLWQAKTQFTDNDMSQRARAEEHAKQAKSTLYSGARQVKKATCQPARRVLNGGAKDEPLLNEEFEYDMGGFQTGLDSINQSTSRKRLFSAFAHIIERQDLPHTDTDLGRIVGDYIATLPMDSLHQHTSKLSLIATTSASLGGTVTQIPGVKVGGGISGNTELSLTILRDEDGYHVELLHRYGRSVAVSAGPSLASIESAFASASITLKPIEYRQFSKWSAAKLSLAQVNQIITHAYHGQLTANHFQTYGSESKQSTVLSAGITVGASGSVGSTVAAAGGVGTSGTLKLTTPGRKQVTEVGIEPLLEWDDLNAAHQRKVGTGGTLSVSVDPFGASASVRGETVRPDNMSAAAPTEMNVTSRRLGELKDFKHHRGATTIPFSKRKGDLVKVVQRQAKGDLLERLFGKAYAQQLRDAADNLAKSRGRGAYHDQSRAFVLGYKIKDSQIDYLIDKHHVLDRNNQLVGLHFHQVEDDMNAILANPVAQAEKLLFDVSVTETLPVMDGAAVGFGLKRENSAGFVLENSYRLANELEAVYSGSRDRLLAYKRL
ncbi:hypothetical protein [Shewanella sp. YLB-07]|uniref:hypothetical protein n=1 Tax=Shewanella sp. YLB-07 TaxID=2601268 RepID=UPI00128D4001|nr:hypothetical protein [Shewanella sp. YLB-07]MPY24363.1 hypothetical protein [Shewanella sp. YLB-07]